MTILRIRMVSLSSLDGLGVPLLKLVIRTAVVVAGFFPAIGFGIAAVVWLSRDPEHAPMFSLVVPALVSAVIWSVWNAILIGRKRDAIYDRVSRIAVVRHDDRNTAPLETVGSLATIIPDEPTPADASDTIVIRSNRWKTARTTLFMALVAALFGFTIASGHDVAIMIPGLIFVIVLCVMGVISTIFPPTLTVNAHGIRVAGVRSWSVPWTDIVRFRIILFRRSSSVVIDYRSGREATGIWARFRQPKGLPKALWMRPVELQELLQARLTVARAAEPNTSAPHEAASLVAEPTTTFPWASVMLILALGLAFAAEIAFPATPATAPLQPSS